MNNVNNGVLFSDGLSQEIKECFYYVDNDPILGERLFFANAGGSFRLKKAVDTFARIDSIIARDLKIWDMSKQFKSTIKKESLYMKD